MDAIVQLIRNALCCVKDLEWFKESLPSIWDPEVTRKFLGSLPEPLDKTTPLEVVISITQFYVFWSASRSGTTMMATSIGKLRRIGRLIAARRVSKSDADRLINASLIKEAKYALRSSYIGFLVLLLGICFFWLGFNSWHVTETEWIGGLPALIHALTVAEIALLVMMYYMWKDAGERLVKAARLERLAAALKTDSLTAKDVGLPSFEALTKWVPFWDAGVDPWLPLPDPKEEEKLVEKEHAILAEKLKEIVNPAAAVVADKKKKDSDKTKANDEVDNEKLDKLRKQRHREQAEELLVASTIVRWEGYREYLYFVLNAIAFYGYALCVVAYYFDDEDNKPHSVRHVMLHMKNEMADWHGNFVGDLMWTIEPMVILGSPYLFSYMRPKPQKIKAD